MDSTGTHPHRNRRRRRIVVALVTILLLLGGYYLFQKLSVGTQTIIQNDSGVTKEQAVTRAPTIHITETAFGFDVPADWKKLAVPPGPYTKFSYQSSLEHGDNRYLDIYMDAIPVSLAVNKELAVRATGNTLSYGTASDNCLTFTQAPGGSQKPLALPAKWDGVDFLCDNDNTTRNMIGTSSPGMTNKVLLTGPRTGSHTFFFTYTDNNYNPDYTIFYRVLDTFTVT